MHNVLIINDTIGGTTQEAAMIIADELRIHGAAVTVSQLSEACNLDGYDTIMLGSYMRYGQPTAAMRRFIKRNLDVLQKKQVLLFQTCMHLAVKSDLPDLPLYIDAGFNIQPGAKLNISDKTHLLDDYLKKLSKTIRPEQASAIAFFKGRMDFKALGLFDRSMMKIMGLIIPAVKEDDGFNEISVRSWAAELIK